MHPRIKTKNSLYQSEILIKILRNLLELLDTSIDEVQLHCFDLIVSLVSEVLNLNEFQEFYKSQESSVQPISKSQLSILKIQESKPQTQLTQETYTFIFKSIPKDFNKLIYDNSISLDLNLFYNLFNGILLKGEMIIKFLEVQVEDSVQLKVKRIGIQEQVIRKDEGGTGDKVEQNDDSIDQAEISNLIKSSITILSNFNKPFSTNLNSNLSPDEIQELINEQLILICKLFSSLCETYHEIVQDLIRELGGIERILKFNEFNLDLPYFF